MGNRYINILLRFIVSGVSGAAARTGSLNEKGKIIIKQ